MIVRLLALLVLPILVAIGFSSGTAHAATFDPGRIIDDVIFTNASTMSVAQIQNFLNSKVPTCDTSGTLPASDFGRPDLTHAQYAAMRGWQAPPYTCLKDFNEGGRSAAQIIYDVSQQYQINPQVFIVLLQKESGLVTDTWPLGWQYRSATGYGCPDSTPGVCDSSYYGFTNQVSWAGRLFRSVINQSPGWYSPYVKGQNFIQWSPIASCGGSIVNVQNWSTAALYDYTPYQPNTSALSAGYGMGDGCSAYGNRNFWLYFNNWFGSTIELYLIDGISYAPAFDPDFYLQAYPDVKAVYGDSPLAAFDHFTHYGLYEGRQASQNFNVQSYKNANQDLRVMYRNSIPAYFKHYVTFGKYEGRISSGNIPITYITSYKGRDYSAVYDFVTYINQNKDLQQLFSNDDAGAIEHFVAYGMNEGRRASLDFDVIAYRNAYYDLRRMYGDELKKYFIHYLTYGKSEGRSGTLNYFGGQQILNTVNYADVYNFNDYLVKNSDIQTRYSLDDMSALKHFVLFGMSEGRLASTSFDVMIYKNRYPDLQSVFKNDIKSYYLHYMYYGKKEGRTGI